MKTYLIINDENEEFINTGHKIVDDVITKQSLTVKIPTEEEKEVIKNNITNFNVSKEVSIENKIDQMLNSYSQLSQEMKNQLKAFCTPLINQVSEEKLLSKVKEMAKLWGKE